MTGRLHVAVSRKPGLPARRIVLADTEPLVAEHPDAAVPADPQGLRTLSFAAGFRSGGEFAVVNLSRLEAAASNPDAPAWHRSVWAEILCPSRQSVAVAAATIAAVETPDSALAAAVARGLFVDRGLTADEASRADPHDDGLGSHLARLGLVPDDLVGVGRSAMTPRPR